MILHFAVVEGLALQQEAELRRAAARRVLLADLHQPSLRARLRAALHHAPATASPQRHVATPAAVTSMRPSSAGPMGCAA